MRTHSSTKLPFFNELDQTVYYVMEIEDGLLSRLRPFETRGEALAAAGVEA